MSKNKKISLIMINITCILVLLVVLFPLLLISKYNRPSADDWSYGVNGYHAIRAGGGLPQVLKQAVRTAYQSYVRWEGRFTNAFFASLQPGIWGERYYGIVAYLMLGAIILSEIYICSYLCNNFAKSSNRWYWIPIIIPSLAMQILYCPYPVESFYWYTGSVNYTFVYGLSLILLVLCFKLGLQICSRRKYILTAISSCVLAICVGGDNFATSLSCFLSLCVLSVLFLVYYRKAFCRTWYVTLIMGIALLLCITAPGNANRLNGNFGGETGNALNAILMSLVRSATNIYSWSIPVRMWLLVLFILPFLWMAVKNIDYKFRFPALFTLVTFGLYASQITATMYVDGTTGGGRMAAILWYSYVIWLVGNVAYWAGWLSRRTNKVRLLFDKIGEYFGKFLIVYCGLIGLILVAVIFMTDLRTTSSLMAYRDWRQGWAQQYAAEWDARIEILRDDSVKEVEFAPLTVLPEVMCYTDLQEETGYYWVNRDCAKYYGKEYIHIVIPEQQ